MIRSLEMAAQKARQKFWNIGDGNVTQYEKGPDLVNNDMLAALDSLGTSQFDLVGLDASNRMMLGGAYHNPFKTPLIFNLQPSASIATQPFFANGNFADVLEITKIDCIFATADGAVNTGYITVDGAGVAPGSGTSAMSGTFDLNATANTLQTATLTGVRGTTGLVLNAGDQLTFVMASAVTSLAGLQIIVWVKRYNGLPPAEYHINANGSIATKTVYLNVVPGLPILGVSVRWSTAATNAGAVTVDVTKDTGTTAPGAGTSILAAAQSVKGTINTTVFPALSGTASVLLMAAGDRLAVKLTGTLTALAGLVVDVFFGAAAERSIVIQNPHLLNVAVDRTLFIADRHYIVEDYWATWSTASTSNFGLLTKDGGTTAPGAGTALLSDNTSTGIDTNATANTPVEGTLVTKKTSLILAPGDRLGEKNIGTTGSLAGVCSAIRLTKL